MLGALAFLVSRYRESWMSSDCRWLVYVYVGSLHASSPNESSAFFCFFGFLGFPVAFSLSFVPGALFGSLSSSSAETRILRFPSDCAFRSANLSGLEVEKDRLGLSVLDLESSGFASSVPSISGASVVSGSGGRPFSGRR